MRPCLPVLAVAPEGGFRQSGLGREGGRAAVESYTELKTVLLPFTDEMM
jgi:aldehyde dehydrogenase (NAD+)